MSEENALVKLFESHANITLSSPQVSSPRQTQLFVGDASPNPRAPFDGGKFEPWRSKPVEGGSIWALGCLGRFKTWGAKGLIFRYRGKRERSKENL